VVAKKKKLDKELNQLVDLDTFLRGLRGQLRTSIDGLREELNKEKGNQEEPEPIPVFLLEEIELSLGCRIEKEVKGTLKAGASAKGMVKVWLLGGEAQGQVGGEVSGGRGAANEARLRIVMKPKEAYWDVDGWRLKDEIFLAK
jgi:hypothetical protein